MRWLWPVPLLAAGSLALSTARAQTPPAPTKPPSQDAEAPKDNPAPKDDPAPSDAPAPTGSDSSPDDTAEAAEKTKTCLTQFSDAQRLRREGALIASREALMVCAQPSCPTAVADKCVGWLQEVRAAIPSIVVAARDGRGGDIAEVAVLIDGVRVRAQLDGRPIELDPGLRALRFEHPPDTAKQLDLLIVASEKNRRVELTFAPPNKPAPPLPAPAGPLPSLAPATLPSKGLLHGAIAAYAIGGVGLIAGSVLGALALDRAATLRDVCGEAACNTLQRDTFDEGARLAHGATGSFVVAGLGAALGTTLLVLHMADDDADEPLQLSLTGAGMTLRGAF